MFPNQGYNLAGNAGPYIYLTLFLNTVELGKNVLPLGTRPDTLGRRGRGWPVKSGPKLSVEQSN